MRERPDVVSSSDDYARRFAGPAGEYLLRIQQESIEQVLRAPFGVTALDVGGGHVQLVPILLRRGVDATVFGSTSACHERLRAQYGDTRLNYVTGDLLCLPFPDRSFDLVISVRLISHIENWSQFVGELCRIARRTVVLDYPALRGLNVLTPLLFRLKKGIEGNTRQYRNFSDAEIARAFTACGFAPTARRAQFFLPMVLHRMGGGSTMLRWTERLFHGTRLTSWFGSPVVRRFDRLAALGSAKAPPGMSATSPES